MELNLRILRIVTEELIEELDRLRDVEFADLLAAVFGAWVVLITLGLSRTVTSTFTGLVPGLLIVAAAGYNVYSARHRRRGKELLNHVALFSSMWMMLSAGIFDEHAFLRFSNTFSGMWIGIASAYAAFLRQNDLDRETSVLVRGLHF